MLDYEKYSCQFWPFLTVNVQLEIETSGNTDHHAEIFHPIMRKFHIIMQKSHVIMQKFHSIFKAFSCVKFTENMNNIDILYRKDSKII